MLDDVEVKGQRVRSFLQGDAMLQSVSMDMMMEMPKIMGNADPMRYAQLLPGVQTNAEFDAGLHIQGCDNGHNIIGIDGVPIYNPAHLMGFFSVFNPTHFSQMSISKSSIRAESPNRLGGMLNIRSAAGGTDCHTQTEAFMNDSLHADLAVGPMSSQGTLSLPTGQRSRLTLSARAAYLNLLYSRWMKIEDEEVRYFFSDYNLNYTWCPDPENVLWAEAYYGNDRVKYLDSAMGMDTKLEWSNAMAAIHWRHEHPDGWTWSQKLYVTSYQNRFHLLQTGIDVRLPSDITTLGFSGKMKWGNMTAGIDYAWHTLLPQAPDVSGAVVSSLSEQSRQYAHEMSLFADHSLPVADRLQLNSGLRLNCFRPSDDIAYVSADPSIELLWQTRHGARFGIHASVRHQYLVKTGFSAKGMPTEFWMAANSKQRPQYSGNLSLTFDSYLFRKTWKMSAELYYKRLFHQLEYEGNVFDFLYSTYDLDQTLIEGNGYNYGFNIMLEKRKGSVTGWLSYAYGRAFRRFPDTEHRGRYPATHDRPHEVNLVATYRLNRHWSFGGTFVFASGTPYTRAKQMYLLNSCIITEFGEHNGARLNPYLRLDLSANYDFNTRKNIRSGLNFSIYNVTMYNNDLFYRVKIHKEQFAYKPYRFILPLLPSISYYLKL